MYKSFAAIATLGATVSAQTTETETFKVTTTALDTATTQYGSAKTTTGIIGIYSVSDNFQYTMMPTAAMPAAGLASMASCFMEPGEKTYSCLATQYDATSLFTFGWWSGLTAAPEFGNSSTIMEQLKLANVDCGQSTGGADSILPATTLPCTGDNFSIMMDVALCKKTDTQINWAFTRT